MEESHIVDDLVAIVPGVEDSLPGVIVQHRYVGILIVEGNIRVLVARSVCVVGKIDLSSSQVRICHIEGPTNDEGLAGASLGIAGIPAVEDLQCDGVHPTDHNIAGVLVGGVDSPQPVLIHHEVDVGEATPGVREGVVVTGGVEAALYDDAP